MSKEEKLKELLEGYCEWCMAQGGYCHASLEGCTIFDARALLKPCETCGGSGYTGPHPGTYTKDEPNAVPCPNCPPSATEFTRRFRDFIKLSEEHLSKSKIGRLRTYGKEACDIIVRQAEQIKRLEEALKKYGRHLELPPCQKGGAIRCSCGFDQSPRKRDKG